MSGNSLASILAWMKVESRLCDWGLVVALERRKTNLIVLQEYIKRFDDTSYLPPITGEVKISGNIVKVLLHDFVMDVPVLSFEGANLNRSKAMLTMAVMGGSQLTLAIDGGAWRAYKVDQIDPLQGPKLHLDLLLNEVPGDVDEDGRVKFDLSKSDNFRLTFAETQHEQRLGGDFFKDLFNQLPDEKRVYTLGKIERGTNELLRPQSFKLWTQASSAEASDPQSSEFGNGAVLAFVKMEGRTAGGPPGSTYKYLIPDDQGKNYSATVLFDERNAAAVAFLGQLSTQFGDFVYTYDQEGYLTSMVAKSGRIILPAENFTRSVTLPDGRNIDMGMHVGEFVFVADNSFPLNVVFSGRKISIDWKPIAISDCVFTTDGVEPGVFKTKCSMDYVAEYEIVEEGGDVLLKQTRSTIIPLIEFPDLNQDANERSPVFWVIIAASILIPIVLITLTYGTIVGVFLSVFVEKVNTEASISSLIKEVIKLNFGQAIQGDEVYAPRNIGFFGRINPQHTSFLINPMQTVIKAGSPQPFATTPLVAGVEWTVKNLIEGPGSPGTINSSTGVYTAPAASTIKGRFTRVRVTATDPATDYYSSALVTVVVDELAVHPLIQICDLNSTVELSAGVLGEGQLQWSIKDAIPGESGEVKPSIEPEGDHTYHHGPEVANKTYVLDQIEVKNTATGGTRSVHVLALQMKPGVTVEIFNINIAQGLVQLRAIVNKKPMDAQWSLPLGGPGTIDQTGLYRAAPSATERFVVIFALVDGGPFGNFEGHLILPLPLIEFPQWLEVLSK